VTADNEPIDNPESANEPEGETPEKAEKLPDDHPAALALSKANKEAEKYRLQVKEYEDSQKSDQERQSERLAEMERNSAESLQEAARLRVALRTGLTETQAKRLVGDTEEELSADAEALLSEFATPKDGDRPATPRRPTEALRPGATPTGDTTAQNPLEASLRSKLGIT